MANIFHAIVSQLVFLALGYILLAILVVGGMANTFDLYLRPPLGSILTAAAALTLLIVAFRLGGWKLAWAIALAGCGLLLASAARIIPGSLENFMNDATSRIVPDKKTVAAHMTDEEKRCEEDQFCKFAPITEANLAILYRDAYINGLCDRHHSYTECRPSVTRASVTGAVLSQDVRGRFPIVSGIYYDPNELQKQSLIIFTSLGSADKNALKSLADGICAFVDKRYPAVEIKTLYITRDAQGFDGDTYRRSC